MSTSPHRRAPTPAMFGHDIAMEAVGSGISWEDDHPPHGLEIPYIEFRIWSADDDGDDCGYLRDVNEE